MKSIQYNKNKNIDRHMTFKFKIGDVVKIKDDMISRSWYHSNSMKIIAHDKYYYYTDYWHKKHDFSKVENEDIFFPDGISEECLFLLIKETRKQKIKKIYDRNEKNM